MVNSVGGDWTPQALCRQHGDYLRPEYWETGEYEQRAQIPLQQLMKTKQKSRNKQKNHKPVHICEEDKGQNILKKMKRSYFSFKEAESFLYMDLAVD